MHLFYSEVNNMTIKLINTKHSSIQLFTLQKNMSICNKLGIALSNFLKNYKAKLKKT